MNQEISGLVLYRQPEKDCILNRLAEIYREFRAGGYDREQLRERCFREVKRLLDLATSYGFNRNLWQDYLAYLLITTENSFTLTCEKAGAGDGSVNHFAMHDYEIFRRLFHFDFSPLEQALSVDCFSTLTAYRSLPKKEQMYNRGVSERVRYVSDHVDRAERAEEIFRLMTDFYRDYGVGMFGLNKAFRIVRKPGAGLSFLPITNTDDARLSDLIGYELQKKKLTDNTDAFVAGRPANNVLLFGDSGTGKSTMIKALINEYYDRGLRMIEIYKHQMEDLSAVISHVKNRNYRFVIYMDDLSFEDFEIEYKYLKAVIEGGLESRPENVLIYATSNRRHLIKETWNDKNDYIQELHHSDTMQEKLSLVNRFGVTISFSKPSKKEFDEIVAGLAARCPEIALDRETLLAEANKWELAHGGISGRTARQFINDILGKAGTGNAL